MYVRGVPLGEQGAEELCRVLNYCPQMDTLWPRLTMSEVLHVFARLRGLSPRFTKRLLAVALHALRLEKFVNRRFEALSGGTKRKVWTVTISFFHHWLQICSGLQIYYNFSILTLQYYLHQFNLKSLTTH